MYLGALELPAGAIKDPEGIGNFTQIFYVTGGQPGALEVAIAHPQEDTWSDAYAQRLLLSPGDSFYLPPLNMYRLENHSKSSTCSLYYMIIKPMVSVEVGNSTSNTAAGSTAGESVYTVPSTSVNSVGATVG